jgi:hypothetical protein
VLDFLNQTFWDAIKADIKDINNRALSLCGTAFFPTLFPPLFG